MRVILTGGTGLIGTALAASLAADGHEVIALSRHPERARPSPSGVSVESWDGVSADGWGRLVDGAEAIVNLAGASIAGQSLPAILFAHWTPERKRRILQSRVSAGRAVVEAIRVSPRKPSVLIQASGVNYYGLGLRRPLTEVDSPGVDFLAQVCVDWEASTQAVEQLGVRRAIARNGVVLAAQGGILPMMLLPFRMMAGGPLGTGTQRVPWIHIQDEVAAIRFLIDHARASGAFNLTSPHVPTYSEFAQAIGRVLHRPNWLPTPAFTLRALLGEKSTLVLDGEDVRPQHLLDLGFRFTYPEPEAALSDLVG